MAQGILVRDIHQRGTTAAKPLATVVPIGTLYADTDLNTVCRSNGTTWDDIADLGGSSGGGLTLPQTLNLITYRA